MALFLLVTHGSDGDVLPFVGLGAALTRAGHRAVLLTHAPYRDAALAAGLGFEPIDGEAEFERTLADTPTLLGGDRQPWDAFYRRNGLFEQIVSETTALRRLHQPGETVLVGRHTSAVSVRFAAELLGAPVAWVAVAPIQLAAVPVAAHVYGTQLAEGFADVRRRLGLAPLDEWRRWFAGCDTEIGLWPGWFDAAGHHSPGRVVLTGFPLADGASDALGATTGTGGVGAAGSLTAFNALFGEEVRPVLATGGTGRMLRPDYYPALVAAAELSELPTVLVARHRELLPARLPRNVRWSPGLRYADVLPRAAAIVHHGGIGTCARALAAGTPQVLMADGIDRPDNAARLARHGLAHAVPATDWQPDVLARRIRAAARDTGCSARVRAVAGPGKGRPALEVAAELLAALPHGRDSGSLPARGGAALADRLRGLPPAERAHLLTRLRHRLPPPQLPPPAVDHPHPGAPDTPPGAGPLSGSPETVGRPSPPDDRAGPGVPPVATVAGGPAGRTAPTRPPAGPAEADVRAGSGSRSTDGTGTDAGRTRPVPAPAGRGRRGGRMRILLAQNLIHLPSHGGANRSNRLLLEQLAARGHDCHVVSPLTGALATHDTGTAETDQGAGPGAAAVEALLARGVTLLSDGPDAVVYTHRGVTVHAVRSPSLLPARVRAVARDLVPDRTLVPGDDPGHMMLGAALAATPTRVVYLVHTLQQLPFGPGAFYPSEAGTGLVRKAAAVIAVSRAGQDYVREHAGLRARLVYPQVYGSGPFPAYGVFGQGAVTMVNPCGYKGITVLLALADALPDTPFLAVPTWGTQPDELAELRRRPNITTVAPVDDIDEVLRRTGVLLMPSLWDETFGYTCVEAMLRGIPVLASAVGGLGEAKLGVPGLLPVRRVTRYAAREGQARPVPVIPEQDLGPWRTALDRLLTDRAHYDDRARASRAAAESFVAGIDPGDFERALLDIEITDDTPDSPSPGPRHTTADRAAALRVLAARRAAARRTAPAAVKAEAGTGPGTDEQYGAAAPDPRSGAADATNGEGAQPC